MDNQKKMQQHKDTDKIEHENLNLSFTYTMDHIVRTNMKDEK